LFDIPFSTNAISTRVTMSLDSKPRSAQRRWLPYIVVIAAVIVLGAIAFWLARSASAPGGPGGPPGGGGRFGRNALTMPVGVAKADKGDVKITLNSLGTVTPLRTVTVTAQVAGQLADVKFKEGQLVKQGDLLAEIDPRPYQAALTQAEGALARDQASLAGAKVDLQRYQILFKQDSVQKQTLDTQAALVAQDEGTVKSDQGNVDTAKVNLAYTKIVAPVSGRVGLRQIDPGNNVSVGSAVVVLTQLKPMDVLFTLPEDNLPAVLKQLHAGVTLPVDAFDRSGQTKLASGSFLSLDTQISTSTGTVNAKAEFTNDDENLFPNQFVNVKLLLDTLHDAIVIPTSALERGADGTFVYVVQPDKTVVVRNIKTGPTEGERVAVTDGLQVGDLVVTSGADRLRDGAKVELPGENPPPAANGAAAQKHAGTGERGQWKQGQGNGQPAAHHRREAGAAPTDGSAPPAPAAGTTEAKPADTSKPADEKKQ
jgi:multidrug efflux system membrane fusion protein